MPSGELPKNVEYATLGGGCFWCTEAVFVRLNGVIEAIPGYSGGDIENPTYDQVSTGETDHAEVTQVVFDPNIITYRKLLDIFFSSHDPTTLNQQGADMGTQYRSVVFYHTDQQKTTASEVIRELEQKKVYPRPIVTKLEPFKIFYPAEQYHKNYYANHKLQPYSLFVIAPKISKLEKQHGEMLRK
jgi:peptide-methionine (S)-S-oxide reductase